MYEYQDYIQYLVVCSFSKSDPIYLKSRPLEYFRENPDQIENIDINYVLKGFKNLCNKIRQNQLTEKELKKNVQFEIYREHNSEKIPILPHPHQKESDYIYLKPDNIINLISKNLTPLKNKSYHEQFLFDSFY